LQARADEIFNQGDSRKPQGHHYWRVKTGSGKTTQLPKMCLQAGRGLAGLIGHTQPDRNCRPRQCGGRAISDELQVKLVSKFWLSSPVLATKVMKKT